MAVPRSADLLRTAVRLFSEPHELLRDAGRAVVETIDRLLFIALIDRLMRRLDLPARVGPFGALVLIIRGPGFAPSPLLVGAGGLVAIASSTGSATSSRSAGWRASSRTSASG